MSEHFLEFMEKYESLDSKHTVINMEPKYKNKSTPRYIRLNRKTEGKGRGTFKTNKRKYRFTEKKYPSTGSDFSDFSTPITGVRRLCNNIINLVTEHVNLEFYTELSYHSTIKVKEKDILQHFLLQKKKENSRRIATHMPQLKELLNPGL